MCMRKRHVVIDEIYNSVKRYAFSWLLFGLYLCVVVCSVCNTGFRSVWFYQLYALYISIFSKRLVESAIQTKTLIWASNLKNKKNNRSDRETALFFIWNNLGEYFKIKKKKHCWPNRNKLRFIFPFFGR